MTSLAVDLVAASKLVEYVMELAERDSHRSEIVQVLDQLPLPIAVFFIGSRVPRLTNPAWRAQFSQLPSALHVPMLELERTGADQSLDMAQDLGLPPANYTIQLRALHGRDGSITGAIALCLDITNEVVARTLGVRQDALIWGGELPCAADYYNQAWCSYAGAKADLDAVHPLEHGTCLEAIAHAARHGRAPDLEARIQRHDGEYRWHRVKLTAVASEGRWYAVARDVHELHDLTQERSDLVTSARTLRADAAQANRLKDEFIAIVSHELRAPVTTMLLWEKILREQNDPGARSQALDAIRQSALAQSRLVGDLLDVSRAASGKLHVDLRPMLLGDVICASLSAALPAALGRHISLSHEGLHPGQIAGDMARMRQVLDNLLANAIKFTEPGGSVTISTRTSAREIVIDIEDTGRGIPTELLERIFEPFHQSEDVLTRRHGGLGLGLAISRELVQLHGGSLTAASPGIGGGSTFSIRLPVSRRRRTREPSPDVPRASIENRRVLVIDDDERVREALLMLLRRAGATVDSASSAAHGREKLGATSPELMICDIAMPDEDGCSFIRRARAAGCKIPAIALSAHALEVDATHALAAGFDVHLAKPVHFDRLVSIIGSLLIT